MTITTLCVNTDWLGIEGAADLIVDVARRMGLVGS